MNPTILGVLGPGFLNQVPTLQAVKPARLSTSLWAGCLKPRCPAEGQRRPHQDKRAFAGYIHAKRYRMMLMHIQLRARSCTDYRGSTRRNSGEDEVFSGGHFKPKLLRPMRPRTDRSEASLEYQVQWPTGPTGPTGYALRALKPILAKWVGCATF